MTQPGASTLAGHVANGGSGRPSRPRPPAGEDAAGTSRERRRGLSRRARNAVLTGHIAASVAILGDLRPATTPPGRRVDEEALLVVQPGVDQATARAEAPLTTMSRLTRLAAWRFSGRARSEDRTARRRRVVSCIWTERSVQSNVMAPRLVSESQLVERLSDLFRQVGYDGASLGAIAAATGLGKSSLYHRFPGGKQQMAGEASAAVIDEFATSVLSPVSTDDPLDQRLAAIAANLDRFYDGGARYCLLDMLSVGDPGADAARNLAAAATAWIEVFGSISREAGADAATARARAQDAIAAIEGALVVARVTGDRGPFTRAIDGLPQRLLGAATR